MMKKILIAVGVILAGLAIVIALQPSAYRINRSTVIAAPQASVFAFVNDFHNWDSWSPWAKLDPAMKKAFEGSPAGVGAVYTWAGNNDVGEGRMTLVESHPAERIGIKLEFLKPFYSTSMTQFTFKPTEGGTAVNWEMSGHNGFVEKAFCLFVSMDKMIGGDFEKGLAQLKVIIGKLQ